MPLSIVMVSYNSREDLAESLTSLAGHDVLVLDNASQDGTAAYVNSEFPWVHVIERARNQGYATAVNDGILRRPNNDILILNPDVQIMPEAIADLTNYMKSHAQVGLCAPRLRYPNGTIQESARRFPNPLAMLVRRTFLARLPLGRRYLSHHMSPSFNDHAGPVDHVIGAAMYVRNEAIRETGGMCSKIFMYGEDVEWCYRLWSIGWEVHCIPQIEAVHRYHRSSRRTFDFSNPTTRHHWAGILKMYGLHPRLLLGVGHENIVRRRRSPRSDAQPHGR